MTHVERYKAAYEEALKRSTIPRELPKFQQDEMREAIRRESANRVDIEIRAEWFGSFLPEDDARRLAEVYPRLSSKPTVIKAAAEAYITHGLANRNLIDDAIHKAMSSNAAVKEERK